MTNLSELQKPNYFDTAWLIPASGMEDTIM